MVHPDGAGVVQPDGSQPRAGGHLLDGALERQAQLDVLLRRFVHGQGRYGLAEGLGHVDFIARREPRDREASVPTVFHPAGRLLGRGTVARVQSDGAGDGEPATKRHELVRPEVRVLGFSLRLGKRVGQCLSLCPDGLVPVKKVGEGPARVTQMGHARRPQLLDQFRAEFLLLRHPQPHPVIDPFDVVTKDPRSDRVEHPLRDFDGGPVRVLARRRRYVFGLGRTQMRREQARQVNNEMDKWLLHD